MYLGITNSSLVITPNNYAVTIGTPVTLECGADTTNRLDWSIYDEFGVAQKISDGPVVDPIWGNNLTVEDAPCAATTCSNLGMASPEIMHGSRYQCDELFGDSESAYVVILGRENTYYFKSHRFVSCLEPLKYTQFTQLVPR